MKTTYEAKATLKTSEEDVYETGCKLDTSNMFRVDLCHKADSLEDLLEIVKQFHMVGEEDLLLDSCDEEGRLDVQVLEDAQGCTACRTEIQDWEQGLIRLWLAQYFYEVEKVTREVVQLSC